MNGAGPTAVGHEGGLLRAPRRWHPAGAHWRRAPPHSLTAGTHGGGQVFVAPFDVVLSDHDVVQPDVLVVTDADAHVLTEANMQGRPAW